MPRRRPYWNDYGGGGVERSTTSRVGSALKSLGGNLYDYSVGRQEEQDRTAQDERNFEQQKEYASYTNDLQSQKEDDKLTKALQDKIGYEQAKLLSLYTTGQITSYMFKEGLRAFDVPEDTLNQIPDTNDLYDDTIEKEKGISREKFYESLNPDAKKYAGIAHTEAITEKQKREQKKKDKMEERDYQTQSQKEYAGYTHGLNETSEKKDYSRNIQSIEDDKGNVTGYVGYNKFGEAKEFEGVPLKQGQKIKPKKEPKKEKIEDPIGMLDDNKKLFDAATKGYPINQLMGVAQKKAAQLGPDYTAMPVKMPKLDGMGEPEVDENNQPIMIDVPQVVPKEVLNSQQTAGGTKKIDPNDPDLLLLKSK